MEWRISWLWGLYESKLRVSALSERAGVDGGNR